MRPLTILFGSGLTVATSIALGLIVFRWLGVRLRKGEEGLLAFVTGSACLSMIVFALCATHLAYKAAYLIVAAIAIGVTFLMRRRRTDAESLPPPPRFWRWTFLAIFAAFTVFYFFTALAPEMSPDGTTYHLSVVDHYNRTHGFERVPTSIYFNISQGAEILFLMAFAFGKHSAAAMVHFAFLVSLPWMMIAYARRFGFPEAGVVGAVLVYVSPVVGVDGLSAYVDLAMAAALFAMFYILQIWDEERRPQLLLVAAMLAGFAFAVKYTAFVGGPYAIAFVAWKSFDRRAIWKPLRSMLAMAGIMALFVVPWLAKNWLWVGDPVAPFATRLFPNPWVHVSFEDDYRRVLRTYDITDRRQIPWELTVRGGKVSGLLGPMFLLTPLALFALRRKQGRQLLIAGAIFALPWFGNIGTRFLIPVAPLFALALALVFASWRWVLLAITVSAAVLCWPTVVDTYCEPSAWRVDDQIPFRAALRIESEDSYLSRKWPGYQVDRLVERTVPKGESVFMLGTNAESYTTRRMLVKFLSAPNEVLGDILLTPIIRGYQPTNLLDFRFMKRTVRKLRLVQTWKSNDEMWSVAEVHAFAQGRELTRAPQWRLSANPNPWDVQLAFDSSPVTRWRSWQPAQPGMFIEIDFGQATDLDEVKVMCSDDYANKQVRLESLDDNKWSTVPASITEAPNPIGINLRRAAVSELKAHGVGYLLLYDGDPYTADFRDHAAYWGIRPLGSAAENTVYKID